MAVDETPWPGPGPYDEELSTNALISHYMRQVYYNFRSPGPVIHLSIKAQGMLNAANKLHEQMEALEKSLAPLYKEPEDPHGAPLPKPPRGHGPRPGRAFARNGKKRY